MKIVKANGEMTAYDPQKIIHSLQRVDASPEIIQQVLEKTEKELNDGMTTTELYKIVFRNLKQLSRHAAGKYTLKNAIMQLGPTGFPFEKYVAALLEEEGYQTQVGQIISGHCVKHEVDIFAKKDNSIFIMECKFHSTVGNVCDVKTALYVYARFLDLSKVNSCQQGWLVTNTRLTKDAEQYGKCVGLGLLSWNFPEGDGLRDKIDRTKLYPITCLTTLSEQEKMILLKNNIVLCRSLCENPRKFGLKEATIEEIIKICAL